MALWSVASETARAAIYATAKAVTEGLCNANVPVGGTLKKALGGTHAKCNLVKNPGIQVDYLL